MSEGASAVAMGPPLESVTSNPSEGASTSVTGNSEEIRTIFVLGFPPDVKEREFWNLLKWWPGYEACMMDFKGEQPLGFARFRTAALARSARDMIQNVMLDRDGKSRMSLRAEMARKNLYIKPPTGRQSGSWNNRGTGGTYTPPSQPAPQLPQLYSPHPSGPQAGNLLNNSATYPVMVPGGYMQVIAPLFLQSMQWSPQHMSAPGTGYTLHHPSQTPYGFPLPASHPVMVNGQISPALVPTPGGDLQPMIRSPVQNSKDHPPCNTLFVGNLGMGTNEWEIRAFFGSFPGFRQLKILRSVHGTTCFVEYQDIQSAAFVHQNMQGAVLSSSNRGGMRIQFSKHPFGCRGVGGRSNGDVFQYDRGEERITRCVSMLSMGSDWSEGEVEKNLGSSLMNGGNTEASDG